MRLEDVVLFCPQCRKKYVHTRMLSGNTLRAIFYSDGKVDSSMLYDVVQIIRCSKCGQFVWTHDMQEIEDHPIPERGMSKTKSLSLQGIYEALETCAARCKDEERYLRVRLWHLFNDRIRRKRLKTSAMIEKHLFPSKAEKAIWHANFSAIILLLNESDTQDQLMKAEIHCEQGQFLQAKEIIDALSDIAPEQQFQVQSIYRRCQAQVPFVEVIATTPFA